MTSQPDIHSVPVAHLPVLRALIDRLGIHSIIDAALPRHALARVSDADCVVTMMLNVLCGRVALFRMDEWMARTDVELLLGPGREADAFDDYRLAAALDHIDKVGTDTLLTAVVKASDSRANRDHLARLARLLPPEDEVTIVGVCKLVDGQTVGKLLSAGFHFVSLLPDTYSLRTELIEAAGHDEPDAGAWPLLGSHPGRRKADPPTLYRGRSFERTLPVLLQHPPDHGAAGPAEGIPSEETMRFVVVYSDGLAALFDGQLEGRLAKEREAVAAAVEAANRKPTACEIDGVKAATKGMPKLRFHRCTVRANPITRPVKRAMRGRPRKGEDPPTETVWMVEAMVDVDPDAIAAADEVSL